MTYYYYTAIKDDRPVSDRIRAEHLSIAAERLNKLGYTEIAMTASEPIEDGAPLTPRGLIYTYKITLATDLVPGKGFVPNGKLRIERGTQSKRDGYWDAIVASKPEIIEILTEEAAARKRAFAARQAKIDAIPGLAEIERARADLAAWHEEWEASFEGEGGGGIGVRPKPKYDLKSMYDQYHKAVAYLNAREYSRSENIAKASFGEVAVKKILDGEDYNVAVTEMEAAWAKYCMDHAWD